MERWLKDINDTFEKLPHHVNQKRVPIIIFILLITSVLFLGMNRIMIDESTENWFREDEPVKKAYDHYRSQFGSDEYIYIVYKAADGDVFSHNSLTALYHMQKELREYRLYLEASETSPLDHIEEVISLINVKYMEAKGDALYSKNFIGDNLPLNNADRAFLRQRALAHPDYPQLYLSKDSRYGGILIRTDFNAEKIDDTDMTESDDSLTFDDDIFSDEVVGVSETDEVSLPFKRSDVTEYSKLIKALNVILDRPEYQKALTFYPVGNPVIMDFFYEKVIKDLERLILIVLFMICIMLWILFRSLAAVIWPMTIIVITLVWTLGIIGYSGVTMTAMIQVIVFLILSVGVASAVHIQSGYLFFRNNGLGHGDALCAVMKKSGLACFLTSTTTALGLISLFLVPLKPIAVFGLFASIGVMIAFFLTIILLPIMLHIWSPIAPKKEVIKGNHLLQHFIQKIEGVGVKRPMTVISVFVILSLFFSWGFLQLRVDSDVVKIIKKKMPLRHTYELVDEHMGGVGNMAVMIDLKKEEGFKDPMILHFMESLQGFIEKEFTGVVTKTFSLVNVVKDSYKALNNDDPMMYKIPDDPSMLRQTLFLFENANLKDRKKLVTDDYESASIRIHCINLSSVESLSILNRVENYVSLHTKALKTHYPDMKVTLTGNMTLLAMMLDYISWSQIKSFSFALLVISLVLFMVLGSKKVGAIAMIPNLFPILSAFGLMGFFHIPLDADTLLIAPVIIGLAVDDTIHFLTHFRLEMKQYDDISKAAVHSIREAGQAISFTSLILSMGFLMFILSFHNGLSNFGIFSAIAILMALVADILLLPALLIVFGADFKKKCLQIPLFGIKRNASV